MKTKFIALILFVLITSLFNCAKNDYEPGAELIAPKQLLIKSGFKAYLVTNTEGETSLLIENDNNMAKPKKPVEQWRCACSSGTGKCIIISEEGSNTAYCAGFCSCGFFPEPLPKDDDIKDQVFISKKLLIDNSK